MSSGDLEARAREWLAADPDPATRAELRGLLESGDHAALAAAFAEPLRFGTAGIRGPLGCGPARMNRLVVRRVTTGLARWLAGAGEPGGQTVVVGRDARHGSESFAADTVAVLRAAGFDVQCYREAVPTPVTAFTVRHLDAAAGVQITASHNPRSDNGYKVYGRGGALVSPPGDEEISAAVDAVGLDEVDELETAAAGEGAVPDPAVWQAYRLACLRLLPERTPDVPRIVYTALHGVAGRPCLDLLEAAGFGSVTVVAEQHEPDPDFPTVAYPNPEAPGVLDLACRRADEVGAELVLANDPDGDRVAAAVPTTSGWRALSGDEIGCVLAEHLLAAGSRDHDRLVATTVVSSRLLAAIASHHRVRYVETLTGFKWLARAVAEAESRGARPVLAYEQALGVMLGGAVRDKDGMSAALALAHVAALERAEGRTLLDAVDDLARRHGPHLTAERSWRLDDAATGIAAGDVLERFATGPPTRLAGAPVSALVDHRRRLRRRSDGSQEALPTPAADLVGVELTDGARAQLRPSGTEPVLKCYLEAVEPPTGDLALARQRATGRLTRMASELAEVLGLPAPAD